LHKSTTQNLEQGYKAFDVNIKTLATIASKTNTFNTKFKKQKHSMQTSCQKKRIRLDKNTDFLRVRPQKHCTAAPHSGLITQPNRRLYGDFKHEVMYYHSRCTNTVRNRTQTTHL
jgi:hypothetical protein